MLLQGIHRAGDEARPGAEREGRRRDRRFERAHRRRGRARAAPGGRRVLTLGQAVNLVVEQQDLQIDVAPERVQKMVAADRKPIAVAAHHPDVQVRIGQLDARGDGRRAAVDAVKAVGGEVVRKACRAADAGDENRLLRHRPDLRERALDRLEYGVVAAARAPADFLIGGIILGARRLQGDRNVHVNSPVGRGSPLRSRRS